jgi:hypothetical protein
MRQHRDQVPTLIGCLIFKELDTNHCWAVLLYSALLLLYAAANSRQRCVLLISAALNYNTLFSDLSTRRF